MHTEDLNNANHKAVKSYNNIICAVGGVAIVQGDLSYLQLAMHSLSHLFFFQNVEFFILVHIKLAFLILCVIDQACSVKMAGYWPSSFFFIFIDQDEVEVHENAKKEQDQYPAIFTEQAWSCNKGFIINMALSSI